MKSNTEKIAFVESCFGSTKVARDGANVAVKCPACGEKKGKFSINIENWACHCWICGVKSKNLFFILKKHCDKILAQRFVKNFGSPESKKRIESSELEDEISLPDGFIHLASYRGRDPDVRAAIEYCKSRNITRRDMWYYGIGTGAGFKFRRRVVVPSFDSSGNLNYFVSRSIDKDRVPKYLNASNKKTQIIFNEMNVDWSQEVSLVEGVFDLMKAGENATCLLGSKLSRNSVLFTNIVKNETPVLLALDKDMKSESHKIARSLSAFGCQVRMFHNSTDKDVGEMSKQEFKSFSAMSRVWSPEDTLRFKITSLKSGSIF